MIPLGVKTGPTPRVGHKLEHINEEGKLRKSYSETGRLRALILGTLHLLVDLYQVCSYDAPGVKTGPAPWGTNLNILTKKENFKILFL